MAKAHNKKNNKIKTENQIKSENKKITLPAEVPSLAATLAAIIILLSLISYKSSDPSWFNKNQVIEPMNFMGLFGAYLSSSLIYFFGLLAFWPILAFMLLALKIFKGKASRHNKLYYLSFGVLALFTASAFFSILFPNLNFLFKNFSGGGQLGAFLARAIEPLFGKLGSIILLFPISVISFFIYLDIPRFFTINKKLFRANLKTPVKNATVNLANKPDLKIAGDSAPSVKCNFIFLIKHNFIERKILSTFAALSILFSVIIFFSLIFYKSSDPSWYNYKDSTQIMNHMGLLGAYLASSLIYFFGLLAFWPALALFVWATRFFKGQHIGYKSLYRLCFGVLALFSSLSLCSILFPQSGLFKNIAGGGKAGDFLARALEPLTGKVGSVIILLPILLVSLFIYLNISLKSLMNFKLWFKHNEVEKKKNSVLAKPFDSPAEIKNNELKIKVKEKDLELNSPTLLKINNAEALRESVNNATAIKEVVKKVKNDCDYILPSSELLISPPIKLGDSSGLSPEQLMANARLLEEKLADFGVDGQVLEVSSGPVITMYEYQPAPGIKISKISGLADDLTMAMKASSIRVVAPIPNKAAIGLEIPNPKRTLVSLKELVENQEFQKAKSPLSLVLGVDILGKAVTTDLAKMPHLLIAGATGSGKSVGLGVMIMSILFKAKPSEVKFLMIDPKCVELALYQDLPHLIYPVLSDPSEATLALKWAVAEMDSRYKLLAEKGVRNIDSYNERIKAEIKDKVFSKDDEPKQLPYLVIIIDELADLMMVSAKEVELYITRLAQKARAAGIHLILATQRPSVDVLTGIIKANLPTRISFQVSSKIDSRTILDQMGAEKLLGAGDMLFLPPGVAKIKRLHGAYVSDDEIKSVTDFIRANNPAPDYIDDISLPEANEAGEGTFANKDEKYEEAVEIVLRTNKASISSVQRHLRIGYNRAASIIEMMEQEGIIGPQEGSKPRNIFGRN